MEVVHYDENLLDACAKFWWHLYKDMPYVHRPDGYDWVNGEPIGPQFFVRHLEWGLSNKSTKHWHGEVSIDSIFVALERKDVQGFLVSSVDREQHLGNILSAFSQRSSTGREVADRLLSAALSYFRSIDLVNVTAAPWSKTIEVDSPIFLALMDAGFAWDQYQWPDAGCGVFLGGSLKGFFLRPEIEEKIERLKMDNVEIRCCSAEEGQDFRYYHTGERVVAKEPNIRAVALVGGLVVGHAIASTDTNSAEEPPDGRIWGEAIPVVIPQFRRLGIGKVLYHLGVESIVQQGAVCTFLATGIDNPARFIYRSTPLQYWYTSISGMSLHLH